MEGEKRCTAIHLGTTMVMTVCAQDSNKGLEIYATCISNVVKVLRDGRRWEAKDFHITGDLNVELGLMGSNEEDNEELTKNVWSLVLASVRRQGTASQKR